MYRYVSEADGNAVASKEMQFPNSQAPLLALPDTALLGANVIAVSRRWAPTTKSLAATQSHL
jgi:hypothetical protein